MTNNPKSTFAKRVRAAKPRAKKYDVWDDVISGPRPSRRHHRPSLVLPPPQRTRALLAPGTSPPSTPAQRWTRRSADGGPCAPAGPSPQTSRSPRAAPLCPDRTHCRARFARLHVTGLHGSPADGTEP